MPVRTLLNSTATMLAGAGLGAVAMYLFDPDQGHARRDRVRQRSADTLARTGAVASAALDHARVTAVDLSHRTAGAYHHLRDRDLQQQIRHLAFSRAPRRSATVSPLVVATTALGAAAMGAALMLLFDPQAGPTRRSILRNRARRAAQGARGYLQHATGRFHRDAPASAPPSPAVDPAADEALAARIRSEILLSFPNPQDIYVSCAGGEVTLHGSLAEPDQATLISRLREFPGITAIHNSLRVAATSGSR